MSSNMIKGYQISYDKETLKKVEFKKKEEEIAERVMKLFKDQRGEEAASGFVAGLIAEDISSQVEGIDGSEEYGEMDYQSAEGYEGFEGGPAQRTVSAAMSQEEIEAFREQVRNEVIEQLTAEISDNLQAEMMEQLTEARAAVQREAESIRMDALRKGQEEGEAAKAGIIQMASSQGYEDGLKRAQAEQAQALKDLERKSQELDENYRNQVRTIEPDFVKILKEYVKKICGVTYKHHDEVFTYLLESGFYGNSKEDGFTIYMSAVDYERFSSRFEEIQAKYADRFMLSFSISDELKEGDLRLENEHKIINCGTGVNMTGIFELLDLLSLAESE